MNFKCHIQPIKNLHQVCEANRHTIIITGSSGSGKTYLVKEWAKMLNISDVAVVNPSVNELKTVIDTLLDNRAPAVMCVENLDEGVVQAAYPLLKFLEECPEYLYVAVTCNNIRNIPETIVSRCIVIDVGMPAPSDLAEFANSINIENYSLVKDKLIWRCAKTFNDVKLILELDSNKLSYFESLSSMLEFKDSVSNIAWKLQHYPDNSESPIVLVIRYLMQLVKLNQKQSCLECLDDLQNNRLSKNAIISKLIFDLKYTE